MKRFLRNATMAAAIVLASGSAVAEPTVLLDVDFSETCTAGTEAEPQMFRYSFDFSNLGFTGWSLSSATKVGQAGGSLFISDGATVSTAGLTNVSTTNGAIKVTMAVKLNKTNMGIVQLAWGSAYGTKMNAEVYTDDWTTVEYVVTPTSASSYSNKAVFGPFLVADGIFVKSIKIEQGKEFLGVPTPYLPSDANGESFTARWKAVSGATKYYLDVYSYNAADEKVMFLDNQEVTPASTTATYVTYKVEGLNPGTTYYYVVRAANEDGISSDSEEIEVVKVISSLDKPKVSVSVSTDGSYTASWEAVADAENYFVNVLRRKTLAETGNIDVLEENFDCFTTGTVDKVEFASERDLALLQEEGWSGDELCYIEGALGLYPFMDNPYLATPALDLGDNDGKVTVVITAGAANYAGFVAAGSVKLSLEDAEGNLTDPVVLTIDNAGFKEYTLELTGGTADSKVKIYGCDEDAASKYLFDNIAIQQVKPAGYVSTSTYATAETADNTYSGTVAKEDNISYYITVTAAAKTVVSGSVADVYSDPSDEVLIANFSGVENVVAGTEASVAVKSLGNGVIEVTAADDTVVEVYDLAGRKIAAEAVAAGVNTLSVNATGLAIVKAGTVVAKVIL